MKLRLLTILCAASLAGYGCGGGGGDTGAKPTIQSLTGASPPVETGNQQQARALGLIERADSVIVSTMHVETAVDDDEASTFTVPYRCAGATCVYTFPGEDPRTRVLSEDDATLSNPKAVGTKHGVTLIREVDEPEYRSLGGWMTHSAFVVATDRDTYQREIDPPQSVREDYRYAAALGDLTGTRPTGTATWRGAMVGTPVGGDDRGDQLWGDALLTYRMATSSLDAAFTDIQNIDKLRAHSTASVSFSGVPVSAEGTFRQGETGNRIQGGLYGPGHAEAAGIFEQRNLIGAFGAKRQ